MNGLIAKLYKQGLVSSGSIIGHLERLSAADKKIREIFEALGTEKNITSWDRDNYRTWTYLWGMSDELILFCAGKARGAVSPMAYMNRVLSSWYDQKITTVEQAQKFEFPGVISSLPAANAAKTAARPQNERTYTKQELDALIDDINKIEF